MRQRYGQAKAGQFFSVKRCNGLVKLCLPNLHPVPNPMHRHKLHRRVVAQHLAQARHKHIDTATNQYYAHCANVRTTIQNYIWH